MVLVSMIERQNGKVPTETIGEAMSAIADVLEEKIHIGSTERAALITLCKKLPEELAGNTSRVLDALNTKNKGQSGSEEH
jgi:hypothetical protein